MVFFKYFPFLSDVIFKSGNSPLASEATLFTRGICSEEALLWRFLPAGSSQCWGWHCVGSWCCCWLGDMGQGLGHAMPCRAMLVPGSTWLVGAFSRAWAQTDQCIWTSWRRGEKSPIAFCIVVASAKRRWGMDCCLGARGKGSVKNSGRHIFPEGIRGKICNFLCF